MLARRLCMNWRRLDLNLLVVFDAVAQATRGG
jgi:hypothetical protein